MVTEHGSHCGQIGEQLSLCALHRKWNPTTRICFFFFLFVFLTGSREGGVTSCIFTNEAWIGLERFIKVHALPESLPAIFLTFPVSVGPRCSNSALWCIDFRVSLKVGRVWKECAGPVSTSAAFPSLYQQFREIGSISTLGREPPTWRLYSAHTFLRCREEFSCVPTTTMLQWSCRKTWEGLPLRG